MKPNEKFLEAINGLDEAIITDALTQPDDGRSRKNMRILVIAAALVAICLTACGIHSLSVWH